MEKEIQIMKLLRQARQKQRVTFFIIIYFTFV